MRCGDTCIWGEGDLLPWRTALLWLLLWLLGCADCLEAVKERECSGLDIAQRNSLEEEPLECLRTGWAVN